MVKPNASSLYNSNFMGQQKPENVHGYGQNPISSSQGSFGMNRGMMESEGMGSQSHSMNSHLINQTNLSQSQPPIGQRNYQPFPHPGGYGGQQMGQEIASGLGGMGSGGMQNNYMGASQPSMIGMPMGMNPMTNGFKASQGEQTYEPGVPNQIIKNPDYLSELSLAPDVLREFDEKAQRCKQYKQTDVFAAILLKNEEDSIKIIEYLVKKGVSLTAIDTLQQTALFYAARDGKLKVLNMLLESGCNPNHKDQYGQTAIYYASRENKLDIAQRLIDAGADLNSEDMHQQTCLFYAAKQGNIDMCAKLIDHGSNLNHMDGKRQTALHWAQKSKRPETVDYLISRGASPINRKNERKRIGQK
uniref:Ankyrin repeat protein n=1 Tax=Euplotes harpa TaxID=151035 RepID=A0A7S3IYQ5_9SPIT